MSNVILLLASVTWLRDMFDLRSVFFMNTDLRSIFKISIKLIQFWDQVSIFRISTDLNQISKFHKFWLIVLKFILIWVKTVRSGEILNTDVQIRYQHQDILKLDLHLFFIYEGYELLRSHNRRFREGLYW